MIRENIKGLSFIGLISAIALLFLFWLIYFAVPASSQDLEMIKFLPYTNAFLNACSAFFIYFGVRFIRRGEKEKHIKCMLASLLFSSLFLVSYILYHHYHGDTKFLGTGLIRPFYFFILISHIILSIAALPLVLSTFFMAWKKNWQSHKKLAKITYPIWLYVSVTGVLVVAILKLF